MSKLMLLILTVGGLAGCAKPSPPTVLAVGSHQVTAEVVVTESDQSVGLMHRTSLADGHGMLFVFKQPIAVCMWMRDTLIPLTAAFIAEDGTIVNAADMEPKTDDQHCAARPVSYVLEVPKGFLASRGIAPPARVAGLPPIGP